VADSHLQELKCSETLQTAVSISSYGDWMTMENMSERR